MTRLAPPQDTADRLLQTEQSPQIGQVVPCEDPGQGAPVDVGRIGQRVRGDSGLVHVRPDCASHLSSGQDVAGGLSLEGSGGPHSAGDDVGPRLGHGSSGHDTDAASPRQTAANDPDHSDTLTPGKRLAFGKDGVPVAAGRIAHIVVTEAVTAPERPEIAALQRRVSQLCRDMGASMNARRTYINALTSATKYLTRLRPTCAHLLHSEETIDGARPDLVWQLPSGAVMFDELKTGRYVTAERVADQARAHVEAGWAEFGCAFVGVRVISTSSPARSLLFTPDGQHHELANTWLSIDNLRRRSGEEVA